MAAGVLAQLQASSAYLSPNPNQTLTDTTVAYTCPLTANYAVVHMQYAISTTSSSTGGSSGNRSVAQLLVNGYSLASCTATAFSGGGFISQTGSTSGGGSIMLGPGQTVSVTISATGQNPFAGSNAQANWNVLLTGYEG